MPGQSRYSRLALADAQQRYDVIGDLPSEAGLLVLVWAGDTFLTLNSAVSSA